MLAQQRKHDSIAVIFIIIFFSPALFSLKTVESWTGFVMMTTTLYSHVTTSSVTGEIHFSVVDKQLPAKQKERE